MQGQPVGVHGLDKLFLPCQSHAQVVSRLRGVGLALYGPVEALPSFRQLALVEEGQTQVVVGVGPVGVVPQSFAEAGHGLLQPARFGQGHPKVVRSRQGWLHSQRLLEADSGLGRLSPFDQQGSFLEQGPCSAAADAIPTRGEGHAAPGRRRRGGGRRRPSRPTDVGETGQGGIPGAVVAATQPAPVAGHRQRQPYRRSQRPRQVRHCRVRRDHQIGRRDDGRRVHESTTLLVQLASEVGRVEVTRQCPEPARGRSPSGG